MKSLHGPKDPYANEINPKDLVAQAKMPLDLVPDSLEAMACLGFLEGALKYGRYNWRKKRVKFSVYISALKRHIAKLDAGENCDQTTKVPHLSNMLCCIGIIVDAQLHGSLLDDRPPSSPNLVGFIDDAPKVIKHLQKLFKDETPRQYTIADDSSAGTVNNKETAPQGPLTKRKGRKSVVKLASRTVKLRKGKRKVAVDKGGFIHSTRSG